MNFLCLSWKCDVKARVGLQIDIVMAQAPPDDLLGLTQSYLADPSEQKLNIGVGAYRTEVSMPREMLAKIRMEAAVPSIYVL